MQPTSLPAPSPNQTHVSISPLAAGWITLPDSAFISPADPSSRRTVPSLAFLITHPGLTHPRPDTPPLSTTTTALLHSLPPSQPIHLLFDLGLRATLSAYTPAQQSHLASRHPYTLFPGLAAQLRDGGVRPDHIAVVLLSHVHYDHHGDPAAYPAAVFVLGRGGVGVLRDGVGGTGSHQAFDPDLLPKERTVELPSIEAGGGGGWTTLGGLRALDLLGDGAVYVLDLPGHLPGHIGLLCRVEGGRWVCLAGDAYHDRRILTGEAEMGVWETEEGGRGCIHVDPEEAGRTVGLLRELEGVGVEVVAAHEGWVRENGGRMFPGCM